MGVIEAFYKGNQRRCLSCINMIYAGDCVIAATVDAEVPPDLVPPGVPRQPVPPVQGRPIKNTFLIKKDTPLKKAPPQGSLWQHKARLEPEPLVGELYTVTMASRICPICGYALPYNFDSAKSLTVAVVGDTTSGKSLYISALIKQLKSGKLMRDNQPLTFTCLTNGMEDHYTTNYFEPLFEHKQVLKGSSKLTETTHDPLIYELTVRPAKDRPVKTLNLVIYDTAGEDYVIQQRMVQFTRYVLNADAIIFLADPMTMDKIVDRLPAGVNYDDAPGKSATDGLSKIVALIKRYRDKEGLRSIPIAITLSKSDLLKYLQPISGQYSFMRSHEYRGGIDLRDLKKIDEEARDFIQRFGDSTLLQVAASFKRAHFFATSATGYSADQKGIFPAVEPRRCLDPLFWILYELKVILNDKLF
jgi:hypothetical protein